MLKSFILSVLVLTSLSGCAYLQSVSTTPIPAQRKGKVTAERSRFIILGFNFNNDFVNEMSEDLANQCQGGKVQGILTKHESVVYFPLLFHTVRVKSEGYCVGGKGGQS